MNSCKRRLLKLFRGLFPFQDRLTYASAWGCSQDHGKGVAPQRQIGCFCRLWMRLAGGGGAGSNWEWKRRMGSCAYWESSKAWCAVLRLSTSMSSSACG